MIIVRKIEQFEFGQKIKNFTFIKEIESKGRRRALFRCKCGNEFNGVIAQVKYGSPMTCGCIRKGRDMGNRRLHGESKSNSAEYRCWTHIKGRCYNSTDKAYSYYGGRGIVICEEWKNDFSKFLADMGRRPGYNFSIERIDVNGNYEPNNCIWADVNVQANNKTDTVYIEFNGKRGTITQWSKELNIPRKRIQHRYYRGYQVNEILSKENFTGQNRRNPERRQERIK